MIGVNKDSYLVLDALPAEFDNCVKAMEVDERPTETYTNIGGLEKQIEELVEAIVLPMEQADKFKTIGIKPPKGCLKYGPPSVSCFLFCSGYLLMTLRNWENPSCACMDCLDESMLLETCWTFASTDVYW